MFAPKGLNKSAQGQSRASRDVTLGMNAHKPKFWMFAPKGLNKSAQGQSRASRDVTLGMNAHKPILPCKGYIKSAILMSVRRLRHSRGNLFYVTFRPRNSKIPRTEFTADRYYPFSCSRYSFAG